VLIAGVGVNGYNGLATIVSVPFPNTFTYTSTNLSLANSGGGTATGYPATTGKAFNFTVKALDAFGNLATGYGGVVHLTSTDPQPVLPGDTFLASGMATFAATFSTIGTQTITAADTLATNPVLVASTAVPITARGLTVTSVTPTTTGFTVTFSKPLVPADLTLYGAGTGTIKDVTLVGASVGAITGTLLVDPSSMSVTFNATSKFLLAKNSGATAVLPDDTYTITLVAGTGANGFVDALGAHLDGAFNGGSSNYTKTFTTSYIASHNPVLGVPDFARGNGSQVAISTAAYASGTVTITTSAPHNFLAGQKVVIAGVSVQGYNGTFTHRHRLRLDVHLHRDVQPVGRQRRHRHQLPDGARRSQRHRQGPAHHALRADRRTHDGRYLHAQFQPGPPLRHRRPGRLGQQRQLPRLDLHADQRRQRPRHRQPRLSLRHRRDRHHRPGRRPRRGPQHGQHHV
jgi:hypothetical protein